LDDGLDFTPFYRFVLYGTQDLSGQTNTTLNYTYTGEGDYQYFTIPLGDYYTGFVDYLVLTCDEDANATNNADHKPANSYFRNVRIFEDTNGDDLCDAACTPDTACDDGDACTTGETYDANCQCNGGTIVDSDNDGVCDADDACPGTDDSIIGTTCDDNDACTSGDVYDTNCNCAGTLIDTDGDGVCDEDDICPSGNDNIDTDGDGTPDACDNCNDNLMSAPQVKPMMPTATVQEAQ